MQIYINLYKSQVLLQKKLTQKIFFSSNRSRPLFITLKSLMLSALPLWQYRYFFDTLLYSQNYRLQIKSINFAPK